MKLELKHLAGYLPYGLKIQNNGYQCKQISTLVGIKEDSVIYETKMTNITSINKDDIEKIKPILRPLSDLIIHLEFTDKYHYSFDKKEGFMIKRRNETYARFNELEYLFKNHFDIYGLIEDNLAIDKNTIS